jgi:hypothetical protein
VFVKNAFVLYDLQQQNTPQNNANKVIYFSLIGFHCPIFVGVSINVASFEQYW